MTIFSSCITVVVLLCVFMAVTGQTGPGLPCICAQELDQPEPIGTALSITNANDGSGRLFVIEKRGVIWIFQNGSRLAEPFVDLTSQVITAGSDGMYSIAFHPDYSNNGRAYIYTAVNSSNGDFYNTVYEYMVSGSDPNKLDPTTERFIFDIQCGGPGDCHNGGMMLFGPDNYLYIGHGDQGCCGDDVNDGQNRTNKLSAVHRIDVDTRTGNLAYGIPPDNPFLAEPDTPPEMFAYGFRQPYHASMDRGDPNTGYGYGRIMIGDIGESTWEEIDILESGGNFGWSAYEASDCFKPELCDTVGSHIEPVAAYNHSDYGRCVISGDMYRGSMIPDLNGWFIFSDYSTNLFFGMYETAVDQWEWEVIPVCTTCPSGQTNQIPPSITCMGAGEDGEQYFGATNNTDAAAMRIYRISDPNQ